MAGGTGCDVAILLIAQIQVGASDSVLVQVYAIHASHVHDAHAAFSP